MRRRDGGKQVQRRQGISFPTRRGGGRASNRGKAAASKATISLSCMVQSSVPVAGLVVSRRRMKEGQRMSKRNGGRRAQGVRRSRQSPTHISAQQQQGGHLIMDAAKATVTYTPERERERERCMCIEMQRNVGRRKVCPHI
jgi:hypothetical protein